ncbi:MAG: hypothetical protein KDK56_08345 [Simkania sp.]|nr:hypothetical protein [Simkania sp.]
MATSIPSFQTMSDTARAMTTALKGTDSKGPNPALCREKAKELYQLGLQLISAELRGEIRLTDSDEHSVLPIVTEIKNVIAQPGFQDFIPLMHTLSKVYRVFIELRWYQPWRAHENMPVLSDLKEDFIATTAKLQEVMQARGHTGIGTLFELRCAKRAAMRLAPSDSTWKKYVDHIASVTTAAVDCSFYDIWQALKAFAEDLKKDCPKKWSTWYQTAHTMRWDRLSIQTKQDFDEKIAPKVAETFEEGGNHALCLAKVSMELFRHTQDEEVRGAVFQILTELFQKEKIPGVRELKHHPKELLRKIVRKPDRFGETRTLCMGYLSTISKNKKHKSEYEPYKDLSFQILKNRLAQIDTKTGKKYQQEIEALAANIQRVCQEKNEYESRRDGIESQIEQLRAPTKNADIVIEFENADQAIEEWERLDGLVENAGDKKEELKKELQLIQEVSTAVSDNEQAEQGLLKALLE